MWRFVQRFTLRNRGRWSYDSISEKRLKGADGPGKDALSTNNRTPGETARGPYRQLPQLVAKFTKSAAITHSLLT